MVTGTRVIIDGTCVYATVMERYGLNHWFTLQDVRMWLRRKGYKESGASAALSELADLGYIRACGADSFMYRKPASPDTDWNAMRKVMLVKRGKRMAVLA